MILFAMYEIASIVIIRKKYYKSFWNLIDLVLIFVYATYFTVTFTKPEQKEFLKSL
jgi:hypothetical protein